MDESPRFDTGALLELEDLIQVGAKEADFQTFFEAHPDFLVIATGLRHGAVHCQIALEPEQGGDLIPDFLLERLDNGMVDILDLKRSNVELRRWAKNRHRFRDSVMEVAAQLEQYRNFFEDKANRENFQRRYGLRGYRPRVIAVIGRDLNYYEDVERIRAEALLPTHLELLTYDEIVRRLRQLRQLWAGHTIESNLRPDQRTRRNAT